MQINSKALEISRHTTLSYDEAKRRLESYDSNEAAFSWAYRKFHLLGCGWPPKEIAIQAVADVTKEA